MFDDVPTYGVRGKIAQTLARGDAISEIARRNGKCRNLKIGDIKTERRAGDCGARIREVVARARGAHQLGVRRDALGIAPTHHVGDGIRARDEVELHVFGIELPQLLERVGGVGDARTVHLEAAREEVRVVRGGEQRHGIAVLARAHALVLLEGRPARGHEDHHVEAEVAVGLLGSHEVAVVDGVEGAAHDAQAVRDGGIGAQDGQVTALHAPRGVVARLADAVGHAHPPRRRAARRDGPQAAPRARA